MNPTLEEIIEEIGQTIQQFKQKSDKRDAETDRKIRELETWHARADLEGAGGSRSPQGSAPMLRRALNTWATTGDPAPLLALVSARGPQAAAQVGVGPSGGFAAPEQLDLEIQRVQQASVAMRRLARVSQCMAPALQVLVDVNNAGAAWVGETGSRTETTSPDMKLIEIPMQENYAAPRATQSMLDLAAIQTENDWLLPAIADGLSSLEGAAFVAGDGVGKPRGITTYPTAATADASRAWGTLEHVPTGASGAFAGSSPADPLLSLIYKTHPAYRQGAVFLMNSATLATTRKLKDGQGNYLIQPDFLGGFVERLLGYPIEVDENMPDIAANSLSIAFGNFFRGYRIADGPSSLLRDPFTARPYVVFYAYRRTGGGVVNFHALKFLKFSTT